MSCWSPRWLTSLRWSRADGTRRATRSSALHRSVREPGFSSSCNEGRNLTRFHFSLEASVSIPNVTEIKTNMSLGLTLTRNAGTGGFLVSVPFSRPILNPVLLRDGCAQHLPNTPPPKQTWGCPVTLCGCPSQEPPADVQASSYPQHNHCPECSGKGNERSGACGPGKGAWSPLRRAPPCGDPPGRCC